MNLQTYVFQLPVQAGEIVSVQDHGQRLKVKKPKGDPTELAISYGMARLKRPREGDYVVQYPQGHIDIIGPEDFAAKVVAGGAGVH